MIRDAHNAKNMDARGIHTNYTNMNVQAKQEASERDTSDYIYNDPESPRKGVRSTRRYLCARVSTNASQRLTELAERESIYKSEMLNRIIMRGIPQVLNQSTSNYKSVARNAAPLIRYKWNSVLLEREITGKRYKGKSQTKQLNLPITSTAWKSLQCCSNDIKLSKARIIQTLILNYKPTSQVLRLKNKKERDNFKRYYSDTKPSHCIKQSSSVA